MKNMRYTLALVSLLVNFAYAQCDYSNESQCSNQENCEWFEIKDYHETQKILQDYEII